MGNRMQFFHALDGHDGRTRADNLGAHLVEHVGEIDDLGLAGGIVDNRGALRAHGCHDEVLGRTDAGELERDGGTAQTLGRISVDVAVGGIELNAQGLKTRMCISILRAPRLQPPGMAILARWKRPSRGPITAVEARILATSS